jgi:cell division protein FtsQ
MLKTLLTYATVIVVGGVGAYLATDAIVHADVLRVDEIVVDGNVRMPSGELLALLEGMKGEHILWIDLDSWQSDLLASPWISDATLRRTLPSTIEVTVSERVPIAIARLNGDLYLVDERGVVIDFYGPEYADLDLPIVDGLASGATPAAGEPVVTDASRAALAWDVILSIAPKPELARRLSQIDVSDRHNVEVILAGDPAVIAIGTDRFLPRLQSYVELAPTLRERVSDIDHVDLRFDDRIYVRPSGIGRRHQNAASGTRRR